ncbi:MAG: hypothetical protein NVS2B12_42730 [Ktedonobacteraceae bacterium]
MQHAQPAQLSGFDVRVSPLHWAVSRKVAMMAELLVERGADMSATDPRYGATPLG